MVVLDVSDRVRLLASKGHDNRRIAVRLGLELRCVEAILAGRVWRHLQNRRAAGDLFEGRGDAQQER